MHNMTSQGTTSSLPMTTEGPGEDDQAIVDDALSPTQLAVVMTILSVLSVVGTVGNALAIYVFANLKQKLTSTIFILTLAGTDFITCLIIIPFTISMEYYNYYTSLDTICKTYHFLITTTVPFSASVIGAIAVDRYMCICHPFHHWMNIKRAKIIIVVLAIIIFIFGGIAAMHYTITKRVALTRNVTITPAVGPSPFNVTDVSMTFEPDDVAAVGRGFTLDHAYTAYPYSPGPSYSREPMGGASNLSDASSTLVTAARNLTTTIAHGVDMKFKCDINENLIDRNFYVVFRKMYMGIFCCSCIIVLVLYSLIYRSVISQRRKKLRIKSAQCCLLWNSTSVETPFETAEMTQDIELSNVNGERYTTRQNSATIDDAEGHNNGTVRKSSLSKARIERMRVANIKTAFTLFIVTLVFILAFLPAWLMALEVLEMNVIVFYMYFTYNVVNPFIYAFLNQNFKAELRRILRCGNH